MILPEFKPNCNFSFMLSFYCFKVFRLKSFFIVFYCFFERFFNKIASILHFALALTWSKADCFFYNDNCEACQFALRRKVSGS